MNIQENVLLAPYTTFKIGGPARYFCFVHTEEDVVQAVRFAQDRNVPFLILGVGSNILISDNGFRGLVIKIEIKGVKWSDDNDGTVRVRAGAGEDWENLVRLTVEKKLYGLEGLSSIPGTVGATPVQNIGAYGTDVSRVIETVRALDTVSGQFVSFSRDDCEFGYRYSRFKREKGRYVITAVTYKLSKKGVSNVTYRDVQEYFKAKNIANPSLEEVRLAVIEIRKNKLPDWTRWGTAGSFFKNPIVSKDQFDDLKSRYPGLPGFVEPDGRVKVALGWILDKVCKVKGLVIGNVGTYEKQALVLVAKPGATATEVVSFARYLMKCVKEKTGLDIESEVEWAVA